MDKKSIISMIVEAALFIGIINFMWNKYDDKLDISEQNLIAYKNEMIQLKLKNGELINANDSYILKAKELEEQFDLSKQEIKYLEKKLGASLSYISKLESNIRIDTLETVRDSIVYKKDTTEMRFTYSDDWVSFRGMTSFINNISNTSVYDLKINVPLKFGVTDNYKVFAQSDNPYVSFTEMEGAAIYGSKFVPKKQHWSFGIQGGFGCGYDIITKQLTLGPYVGFGLQYKF